MSDSQIFFERAGETGADQVIEALTAQHHFHPFATNHFADAGMDNVDEFAVEKAADILNALARIAARPFKEPNEIGTFRRQCKSDRDHFLSRSRGGGGSRIAHAHLKD